MSQTFEVPLIKGAQSFLITLAEVEYRFTLNWNDAPLGGYVLDIDDPNDVPIVHGIPLITGVDLLGAYYHLGFGFALYVQSDDSPDKVPTYDNLGSQSHLYCVLP